MAAKLGLVLDCADPEALAAFWSAAMAPWPVGIAARSGTTADGHRHMQIADWVACRKAKTLMESARNEA